MVNNRKAFIFHFVLTILQLICIIGAVGLEIYATKKMGVSRYLIYKKTVFETTLFTPFLTNLYTFLFIFGAFISIVLLVVKAGKREKVISLFEAAIANLAGVGLLTIKMELAAYHFFLIAIMIVTTIQYVKIIINHFFQGSSKQITITTKRLKKLRRN
jgi:hypothetical protein